MSPHDPIGPFGLAQTGDDWAVNAESGLDAGEMMLSGRAIENKRSVTAPLTLWRRRFGSILIGLFVVGVLGRSAYLQVARGEELRLIAENNRTRAVALPAQRGIITDRNGIVLAENLPAFRLLAWPRELGSQDDGGFGLLLAAADLFDEDVGEFAQKVALAQSQDESVLLIDNADYEAAMSFLANEAQYPGLVVELGQERGYFTTDIPTLSHILGYIGPIASEEYAALQEDGYRRFDSVGKQGVEDSFEKELRGIFGSTVYEVDAQGRAVRAISTTLPVHGTDLTLAIDARLQAYVEQVLAEHLADNPVQRAAVVAMDPVTGEVLALVSYPSFDANLFARGISQADYTALIEDENTPLFARAFAGEYPSGSVIKPTFAAAALAEGVVTPATTFTSVGGLWLGDRFFPDWKPGGHGITNVYHAIADSVNTYFYMIGGGNEAFPGMGLDTLMRYAKLFGYGEQSGLLIPSEADGFLPSKEWKQTVKNEPWYIGDTYNVSIGQGDFLATPLQVTRATAAIANGGVLVVPQLLAGAQGEGERVVSEEIAQIVQDGMRQTVTSGTAQQLQAIPVEVAGKTGTAQWNSNKAPHSWFTGYAPIEDPQIAITILIEQGGDEGNAVPVAHDILQWFFKEDLP
ncbi:penicillin-binding protein 2 [Patescibacteria group bacterium]|nr:penicillin-binding protein 2 [Patescibacteria group bacterium]